jgi:hypothetical protein
MAKMISTEGGGELHFKALAMGHSGSGKSSLGATAPKPLILLSETQGKMSILQRAKALGLEPPTIIHMESLQDYRNVVRGLYGDKGQPFRVMDGKNVLHEGEWPETVVLDSLTDACELVFASVKSDAPPKKGDDGLEVISMRHWGALRDRATKLIRAFRDVPVHTLFLCLLTERLDESSDGTTTRWHGPQMPMKALPNVVMQATNLSGLLTRTSSKDPDDPKGNRLLEYGVRTVGPSYLMVKPCRPLKDLEAPDFGAWVNTMKASVAGGEEA